MQLTFREIEKAFEIGEKTLYQWLNEDAMPAVKANDQYYFNSVEVLEWALKNRILLTPGALKLCEKHRSGHDIFVSALSRGGIHLDIKGATREEALKNALELLPLPAHIQKSSLMEMILSREQLGATAIGNGIAIPHVKHPVVLAGLEPVAGLFFLQQPVEFDAADGQKVDTLFFLLTSSFKVHLTLLSRLAFCLQDELVKAALARRSREELIAAFSVAEAKIVRED